MLRRRRNVQPWAWRLLRRLIYNIDGGGETRGNAAMRAAAAELIIAALETDAHIIGKCLASIDNMST